MSHKSYPLGANVVAAMTVSSYLDSLDFDAETVFCFTPSGIREAIMRDKELGEVLKDALLDMFQNENNDVQYERRGFNKSMTDAIWAHKMLQIAKAALFDYAPEYDVDEDGYAEIISERIAAAAAKNGTDLKKGDAIMAENLARKVAAEAECGAATAGPAPNSGPVPDGCGNADDNLTQKKEPAVRTVAPVAGPVIAPLDLYLSDLRPGQGQIARMLVGSAAITTAPMNQLRRYWTEKGMRQIGRVSGYKRGSVTLKYYGEELRLNDIEVWLKILQLIADRPLGTAMTFNTRQFARALGKGIGTNTLKALAKTLTRLKAGTFFIETTCPNFIGNLKQYFPDVNAIQNATTHVAITFNMLSEYVETDNGKEFSVTLGRAVRALIGTRVSFWFDEALYYSLRGDYAKRLFLLYTSHKECYPLTRQEIREFFGCSMQSDDDLHTELRQALDQLVEKGIIEKGWEYMKHPERGMSYVVKMVKAAVLVTPATEVAV